MTAPQRPYMPGYGISTSPDGLLDWEWAVARLSTSHNYWLATTDPDGAPHLAGVWAVWFDDQLCFSTGRRSRKGRNLAADPRCSLSCESAVESVVLRGGSSSPTSWAGCSPRTRPSTAATACHRTSRCTRCARRP